MGGGTVELDATVIPGWQEEQKLLLKQISQHRHTQVHQAGEKILFKNQNVNLKILMLSFNIYESKPID